MKILHSLMNLVTTENGIDFYDPMSIDWSRFIFDSSTISHTVTKIETLKPYLISQRYYRTYKYEHILLMINSVDDPLNLQIGLILKIPSQTTLDDFIRQNTK